MDTLGRDFHSDLCPFKATGLLMVIGDLLRSFLQSNNAQNGSVTTRCGLSSQCLGTRGLF